MIDLLYVGQVAQQVMSAVTPAEGVTFEWLFRVILMPLIFGAYVYTWVSVNGLRKDVRALKSNELKHIEDRLRDLEKREL